MTPTKKRDIKHQKQKNFKYSLVDFKFCWFIFFRILFFYEERKMEDRRKNKDRRDDLQFKLPNDARGKKDRRQKERRTKERIPVKMWVRNMEGDADYFQQTANLSTNGMYILSPNPYEVGTVIDIEFQVPGTDYIIKCGAEILRCTEENQVIGLSAKFVNMSDTDKKIIEKAMDELISDFWYINE